MIKLKDIIKEGVIKPLLESAYDDDELNKVEMMVRLDEKNSSQVIMVINIKVRYDILMMKIRLKTAKKTLVLKIVKVVMMIRKIRKTQVN